uniref:Uncharacterized protein n=1 Tax=Oryza meridionalis TaxID=40149 RepID=A0A0E0DN32_9ORYZ
MELQGQQQQVLKLQADGQFSSAPTKKRLHEDVVTQVKVDRGQHCRPAQRQVNFNLKATPVPTPPVHSLSSSTNSCILLWRYSEVNIFM